MEYLNKVILQGVVGSVNYSKVADKFRIIFSLCTEYAYKENGNAFIDVTWHRCVLIDSIIDIQKGDKLRVEGRLKQTRYVDSSGIERSFMDVIVNNYYKIVNEDLKKYYGDEDKTDL